MNQNLISHFTEAEMNEFITSKVRALESNPFTTVSSNVQYYYKMLKLVESERQKKYGECMNICIDLLGLIERTKSLARPNLFGFAYDNLGQYSLLQRNYTNAIRYFRKAQQYYAPKSFPYLISKEQEFFSLFYSKAYADCRWVLDELLQHDKRDAGEIRYDKFLYYACCLDFVTGKYKESLRVSNLGLQIVKDKSRWEIGLRYMKILSLVELNEFVEAAEALENLRKQARRLSDNGILEKRDSIIFKCLHQYERENFGSEASARLAYLVKRLSKKNAQWSWKYFSHELIPIHRWMKGRIHDDGNSKVSSASLGF